MAAVNVAVAGVGTAGVDQPSLHPALHLLWIQVANLDAMQFRIPASVENVGGLKKWLVQARPQLFRGEIHHALLRVQLAGKTVLGGRALNELHTTDGQPLCVTVQTPIALPAPQPAPGAAALAVPDTGALATFWAALSAARLEGPLEGAFLVLPDGAFLLGRADLGSVLMVRRCYEDLFAILADPRNDPPGGQASSMWVITGNPGIGKTLFIAYVLWRLRSLGVRVVYEPAQTSAASYAPYTGPRFLLLPDGSCLRDESFPNRAFEDVLNDPRTWFITDAHSPNEFNARTVVVTSPRRDVYHEFAKLPGASERYMPMWTWEEITACWERLYRERMMPDAVKDLFALVGGVPREVLQHGSVESMAYQTKKKMHEAIGPCDLYKCLHSIGELAGDDDISHHVLHIIVMDQESGGYKWKVVDFASKWVADRVAAKILRETRRELVEFLTTSEDLGSAATMHGRLLEGCAHNMLVRGGTFTVRRLVDRQMPKPEPTTWTLPALHDVPFHDLAQVDLAKTDAYYRPVSKSQAAVDALVGPNFLLQMTVSSSHPIKMKGLEDAAERVPAHLTPFLCFVVPEDKFNSLTLQPYHNDEGHGAAKRMRRDVTRVQQWALLLPLQQIE